jgi:hypothetical protein
MREKHTVCNGKPGRAKGTKNRFIGVVAAAKAFGIHYTYLESILKGETPDSKGFAVRYRAFRRARTSAGARLEQFDSLPTEAANPSPKL